MLSKPIRLTWTFPKWVNALLIKKHSIPLCFAWTCLITKCTEVPEWPCYPWTPQKAAGAWTTDTSTYQFVNICLFPLASSHSSLLAVLPAKIVTGLLGQSIGNQSLDLQYWATHCYPEGWNVMNEFEFFSSFLLVPWEATIYLAMVTKWPCKNILQTYL